MVQVVEELIQLMPLFEARLFWNDFVVRRIKAGVEAAENAGNRQIVFVMTVKRSGIKNDWKVLNSGWNCVLQIHLYDWQFFLSNLPAFPSLCPAFPDQRSPWSKDGLMSVRSAKKPGIFSFSFCHKRIVSSSPKSRSIQFICSWSLLAKNRYRQERQTLHLAWLLNCWR